MLLTKIVCVAGFSAPLIFTRFAASSAGRSWSLSLYIFFVDGTYRTYPISSGASFHAVRITIYAGFFLISLCDPLTAHWPSEITPTKVWIGAAAFAEVFCCVDCAKCTLQRQPADRQLTIAIATLNTEFFFIHFSSTGPRVASAFQDAGFQSRRSFGNSGDLAIL